MSEIKRIAVWAVPRSLGTVLSRAWENRPDTVIYDELLFVPYLYHAGEDLGFTREMAIASGRETDYHKVIEKLLAPLPAGKTICYQKHQPHNLIVEITGMGWLSHLSNCFLIRHPKDMLLSLHKIVPDFTFEQTGWADLKKLFDYVCVSTGAIPPVIDARDLQNDPQRTLSLLCDAVGIEFTPSMLSWSKADENQLLEQERAWYGAVLNSTHFRPYKTKAESLPDDLQDMFEKSMTIYQELYQYRLH